MEREEGMYVKWSLNSFVVWLFFVCKWKVVPMDMHAFDPNPQHSSDGVLKDVSFSSYFIAGSVSSSPMGIIS